MLNCIIVGVGGQGTILLSRLIGTAAIESGYNVRGTETIGMAQRGGSVVSHLRIGENIASPLIPIGKADVIIAFEPGEAVRALPFLSDGGKVIVCNRTIAPAVSNASGSSKKYDGDTMLRYLDQAVRSLEIVDGKSIIELCGSAKVINVALLGVALRSGVLPFDTGIVESVLKKRIPERYLDMNLKAFRSGLA